MFTKFRNADLGLLLVRLGLAYVFITHAWSKITSIPQTTGFFTKLGLPFPHEFVYFICAVELIGGLFMLFGIWTELAGLFLAGDMLGVIITVRMGPMAKGWLGGHEFELMLLLMALGVALIGPGKYALEQMMKPKSSSQMPQM